jgi:hypothetical protein
MPLDATRATPSSLARFHDCVTHLSSGKAAAREGEGADTCAEECLLLGRAMPDARVFGKDDPASFSDFRKPDGVQRSC